MTCSTGTAASARIRLMRHSYAYASPGLRSHACRHSVTLLVATGDAPVEVQWRHGALRGSSLLVAPLVSRTLCAVDAPFMLLDLEPRHASFRRCARAAAASGGVQILPEPQVQALRKAAQEFQAGRLCGPELDACLQAAITGLACQWPDPGPLDARVDWMMEALTRDRQLTLERMAQTLAMSATRASRLFSAQMGIPFRACAVAAKIHAAARFMGQGHRLTEVAVAAGFADSAHFAKVWLRCYGAPPSAFFPAWRTELDAAGMPAWTAHRPPRPAAQAPWPRAAA